MFARVPPVSFLSCIFFFTDTATTEIYTLSLHDALPISPMKAYSPRVTPHTIVALAPIELPRFTRVLRSEEHTSELQSRQYLVCRLLLEKKKIENSRTNAKQTNAADASMRATDGTTSTTA